MAPHPKSQTQKKTGITIPAKWNGKIPAFLFRGWKPSCGGNSGLNTTSAVTPHAFYGSHREPSDKMIVEIPVGQIKSEIIGHLSGNHVNSHFSSWAADFQTALSFAGVGKDAHIAVFETSLRGKQNEIYHVPALHAIGISPNFYDEEYLVYGPVSGEAYACVSVMHLRKKGMTVTVAPCNGTSKVSVDDLTRASKIANIVRPIRHAMGPDLFLTVFAAELGRLLRTANGSKCGPGWSQEDNKAILTHLSDAVDLAVKRPHKKSLVNAKTYVKGFPQLKAMIDILMTVELEIDRKRSKIPKKSSSTTNVSPASGKKRKADEMKMSTGSKMVEVELQEMVPRNLLKQLAGCCDALQERLQAANKQLSSVDGSMDGLDKKITEWSKRAQVFEADLHRAEASLQLLEKSRDEMMKLVGKEDQFVRPRPQKPRHELPPCRPLAALTPTAAAKRKHRSQKRTRLMK